MTQSERDGTRIKFALYGFAKYVRKINERKAKTRIRRFLSDQVTLMSMTRNFLHYHEVIEKIQYRWRRYKERKVAYTRLLNVLWDKHFLPTYFEIQLEKGEATQELKDQLLKKKKGAAKKGKKATPSQLSRKQTMGFDMLMNDL